MVSLCADTITLLTKFVRGSELPLRAPSLFALADALAGSGGIALAIQQEIIKHIKHVIGERATTAELRIACLTCLAPLVRNSEGLWSTDTLDQLAPLCTKHLDDPVAAVRAAATRALGRCMLDSHTPLAREKATTCLMSGWSPSAAHKALARDFGPSPPDRQRHSPTFAYPILPNSRHPRHKPPHTTRKNGALAEPPPGCQPLCPALYPGRP